MLSFTDVRITKNLEAALIYCTFSNKPTNRN